MVVCGGRGRQAAGVGGVRGLAGRGGVICQSERGLDLSQISGSHFMSASRYVPELAGRDGDHGVPSNRE